MVELDHCGKGYNLESFASRAKKQPGSLLMYHWHGLYHQNEGLRHNMRIPNNSWKSIFKTCSELLRGKHKKILHDSESLWNWSPVYEKPPRASTPALSAISVSVLNAFPAMVARMYMFYSRIFEKLAQTSLLHLLCACLKNQWKTTSFAKRWASRREWNWRYFRLWALISVCRDLGVLNSTVKTPWTGSNH